MWSGTFAYVFCVCVTLLLTQKTRVCAHMPAWVQRLNGVRTPPGCVYVCVCAYVRACVMCRGLWGWRYVGHSHHAPLAPLDRAGSTGEGGRGWMGRAGRAAGLRWVWYSGGDKGSGGWSKRTGWIEVGSGPKWDYNMLTDLQSDMWFVKKIKK